MFSFYQRRMLWNNYDLTFLFLKPLVLNILSIFLWVFGIFHLQLLEFQDRLCFSIRFYSPYVLWKLHTNQLNFFFQYFRKLVVSSSRHCGSLGSSIGIVSRLKDQRIFIRSLAEAVHLSLLYSPHTKSSVQSASCPFCAGDFFHGYSGWEMKLTSHSCLVTSLRMHGAVLSFRHAPSWRVLGHVSFCFTFNWSLFTFYRSNQGSTYKPNLVCYFLCRLLNSALLL